MLHFRHEDGLGIGYRLWMARRIMKLHHGDLTILKEESKLTMVFTFPLHDSAASRIYENGIPKCCSCRLKVFNRVLPINEGHAIEHESERSSRCLAQDPGDAGYKVLVVDDSTLVRRMTIRLMNSLGHSCEEADDGDVAVEMVRDQRDFDIILMDNQMPRMKGEDATRIIRNELKFQGVIIGVTGNALPEEIAAFKRKGVDEVVVKPMTSAIFVNKIDEIVLRKKPKKKQIAREKSNKCGLRAASIVND